MWTNEWPTEPGRYWFYGHKYKEARVEVGAVHVIATSSGVVHILDGQFMFKEDGHKGMFHPAQVPVLPAI